MRNEYGEHSIIRYIGIAAITASMLLPLAASAASVQVYPTITNAHGGTKFAADMTSCIAYDATSQCAQSVPTFTVPDGSTYTVTIQPAAGYSYTLDSNCSGVAQGDITCNVSYADGAPIEVPVQQAPAPAAATPVQQTQVATSPAAVAPITIPEDVTASTTLSQAEQIASLQAQIMQLYKILIALLEQKLAVLQQ